MNSKNLENLTMCLHDIESLEIDPNTSFFTINGTPIDFTELVSQLFDDTGLQDLIDDGTLSDHFSNETCKSIVDLESSLRNIEIQIKKNSISANALHDFKSSAKAVLSNL